MEIDSNIMEIKKRYDFRKIYFVKIINHPVAGISIATIGFYVLFSFIGRGFFSFDCFTSIFTIVAETGLLTIGQCLLIIGGDFDLSVGATYALGGTIFVVTAAFLPSFLAFIIAIGLCAFVGYINGVLTVRMGVPSFVTTLGMMMIIRGSLLLTTRGSSISYRGDIFIPTILSDIIGYGIRPSHFWFVALLLLFSFILMRTPYGNWVFATGGDQKIARSMGVNINKVKVINFIITGVLAGLAGCMAISRFRFANVAFGTLMELESISGAVIGGVLLSGGVGNIIGAGLGALLLAMIRIGVVLAGVPGYSYQLFVGMVLISAAYINQKRKFKK
ncbi:Ribose import permease protein RbsC [subsurface metagenome]